MVQGEITNGCLTQDRKRPHEKADGSVDGCRLMDGWTSGQMGGYGSMHMWMEGSMMKETDVGMDRWRKEKSSRNSSWERTESGFRALGSNTSSATSSKSLSLWGCPLPWWLPSHPSPGILSRDTGYSMPFPIPQGQAARGFSPSLQDPFPIFSSTLRNLRQAFQHTSMLPCPSPCQATSSGSSLQASHRWPQPQHTLEGQ